MKLDLVVEGGNSLAFLLLQLRKPFKDSESVSRVGEVEPPYVVVELTLK